MSPITSIKEAKKVVEEFQGKAQDLILVISDELQDPVGVNMAIITDTILKKGMEPDGFIQKEGFRIYKYKDLE